MASWRSRSVRFQNLADYENRKSNKITKTKNFKGDNDDYIYKNAIAMSHSQDSNDQSQEMVILDPRLPIMNKWDKIFLVACLVSLFIDPLFFYLPVAKTHACIEICSELQTTLTVIRSMVDFFYITKIFVKFRTGFIAPSSSSMVFGRGELVIDPLQIAAKYLYMDFWMDFAAALPLPQVFIWAIIPNIRDSNYMTNPLSNILRFSTIFQYILRLYFIFPLSSKIIKATGFLMKTSWAGAAYNLMLFILASHVLGSSWYLLSIGKHVECWKKVCEMALGDGLECKNEFFDCHAFDHNNHNNPNRDVWFKASNISRKCYSSSSSSSSGANYHIDDYKFFHFGIYSDSLTFGLTSSSSNFFSRYFYCLWWGLRNLSSLGQNLLITNGDVGEINFAIVIAIIGLVLFALLIGNMQTYLQSTTLRLEEWRIRRNDAEQWMCHRQLPNQLKQSVRKFDNFKWIATHGVDEEHILKGLPIDLRRDIKRHLCLNLVRQVPLFDEMDEKMLDAICERLRPSLCISNAFILREGDPVNEMLFIIRGHLDSHTTNGGRTGFFNSTRLGPTDFCGEELLPWALNPRPSVVQLPSSTRTVKALTEVEAFALIADDLKFVAAQFRRLHSKQLRYTFRFYSHQWQTWAACFIQAAWFSYKRRKESAAAVAVVKMNNQMEKFEDFKGRDGSHGNGFFKNCDGKPLMKSFEGRNDGDLVRILGSLQKPVEPDFSVEER